MSEPARIALRLLGYAMFLVGVAAVVLLFVPGPRDVAAWMGENCVHSRHGPSEQCTIFDVLEIVAVAPVLILTGGVMMLGLRPPDKGPFTVDLSGLRRRRDPDGTRPPGIP